MMYELAGIILCSPAPFGSSFQRTVNSFELVSIAVTVRLKDDPNGAGLQSIIPDNSYIIRRWGFYDLFDAAPGTSDWATANGRGNW